MFVYTNMQLLKKLLWKNCGKHTTVRYYHSISSSLTSHTHNKYPAEISPTASEAAHSPYLFPTNTEM